MSIGRFSALSRISVRMLRHYDASGVLVPAVVDSVSGYRWYSPDQLGEASRIRQLRDVGFGVSAIGALLAVRGTAAYADALRSQRVALVDEAATARHRLSLIERMLVQESEEHFMVSDVDIELIDLPPQTLVSVRGTLPEYAAEGELWARLMPELQRQGIAPVGPGGCIEHNGEFRESDVDESVFLEVEPGAEAEEPLTVLRFPAR
ncbi:MAG: MerR family transcriptional regulator, partial [Mycobacteriaceae bacterium]|nr:MerR family transcriptional regulator [Mycobacteriaceae bacterium]